MTVAEFKKAILDELERRDFSKSTKGLYSRWIDELFHYYPQIPPENITFDDLKEFLDHVILRKKYAPGTIKSVFNSLVFGFNEVLERNFDLGSLPRPYQQRKISAILSQDEVVRLLQAVTNSKYKALIGLIYSCGIDVGEAVKLRLTDLDRTRSKIRIRNAKKRTTREASVARYVLEELEKYIREYSPTEWLFGGKVPNSKVSVRSTQAAFKRALEASGIGKNVTLKSLKYSYVEHLEQQGLPLISVLKNLGIGTTHSIIYYSRLNEPAHVNIHSPLDRIIRPDDELNVDLTSLERLVKRVKSDEERDYLLEALQCMKARALRAGIVFAWAAAVQNIRTRCDQHSYNTINLKLKAHNPKAPDLNDIDDFVKIKDDLLLKLTVDLAVFDKNQKDVLQGCLDLRNKCGHPSKYSPRLYKAAAFLEDIITVVFT